MGYVYIINAQGTNLYKVGYTDGDPEDRRAQLQTGCPYTLQLIASYWKEDARSVETVAHKILASYNVNGEWFELPGFELASWAINPEDSAIHYVEHSPRYDEVYRVATDRSMPFLMKIWLSIWVFLLPRRTKVLPVHYGNLVPKGQKPEQEDGDPYVHNLDPNVDGWV
jgi:hypothetical protein